METSASGSVYRCYHCGSTETCKAGYSKYGQVKKQRFFCRGCRKYFREEPKYIEGTTKKGQFWPRKNLPSAGHLILELHAIAQNILGRTPRAKDINELSKQRRSNSLNTYYAVFGDFREALKRARMKPDYPRQYNVEKMIEELRTLRKRLGRPLTQIDIEKFSKNGKVPTIYFLRRAFGSLTKALDAAGAGRKKFSRDDIIALFRKLDAKLEGPVLTRDIHAAFDRGDGPTTKVIVQEFGGMEKARRAAKVKKGPFANRDVQRGTDTKFLKTTR
jgi:hypothetical protein